MIVFLLFYFTYIQLFYNVNNVIYKKKTKFKFKFCNLNKKPVPRPHHISARLVAADEVAEESFRRNVLGTSGPDRQFFKHQVCLF